MARRLLSLSAVALAAHLSAACGAHSTAPSDLEVTRVVLYQSGVAYMEREGRVTGDELVMPIRADQINDILATLVVVDESGEGTSVSLPIDDSAADRLADLPPELRDAGGMVALLYAFRGADVVVSSGDGRVRGRVVGVETIDGEPRVTLLTGGDELVPVAIADIDEVDLRGGSLSTGLRRSLDHSLAEGDWKPTDVTIRLSHDGAHDVRMAYVVEQPIWKPAYRAVVDGDELLLQGWAVVDNTSGVDWNDVRLSLTAGSPISYRYDLHAPLFVERPDMSGYGAPNLVDLRPPTPTAAARAPAPEMAASAPRRARAQQSAGAFGGYAEDAEGDMMFEVADEAMPYEASIAPSADVTEVASMFRFDIPGRVTLPDQTSTMVTLVNTPVEGEDALVFQPDAAPASHSHPYRAILLENSTPYPIQRAPIAIYNAGTFVGQGITPLVAPDESAVVPYAIESRVSISQRTSNRSGEVSLARIVDGTLHTQTQQIHAIDYETRSSIDDEIALYLKVPRLGGYTLEDAAFFAADAVQREAGYYLIPLSLEGGAEETFTVAQASTVRSTTDLFSRDGRAVLAAYLSRPDARPDVATALEPIVEMLEELASIDAAIAERRTLSRDVEARAYELRQNIRTLAESDTNRELAETLAERLEDVDQTLERLTGEIVEMNERRSLLRVMASEALREVTLDADR